MPRKILFSQVALIFALCTCENGGEVMAMMMNDLVTDKKIKIAILVLATFAAMC